MPLCIVIALRAPPAKRHVINLDHAPFYHLLHYSTAIMHLALVHDWLNQVGGAEDVLTALVALNPGAPLYTSIYWRDGMPAAWRDWPIHTLWMDKLPGIYRHHQPYLPLYPLAFEALDLSGYDVILSNKSGFCHGVRL